MRAAAAHSRPDGKTQAPFALPKLFRHQISAWAGAAAAKSSKLANPACIIRVMIASPFGPREAAIPPPPLTTPAFALNQINSNLARSGGDVKGGGGMAAS